VPALEPLHGWRVIANPAALDQAAWSGREVVVLRFASDEAFGIGAEGVEIDDPDAIVEIDRGFVGALCSVFDRAVIEAHTDWPLPRDRGVLAQGKVAGVPVKVWTIPARAGVVQLDGDDLLLVTQAAYAAELRERLGWS
jgi:hypothetical protein